jgi:SpoVK/Ycf46/Vps4 family AAA+-type ATPase
MPAVSMVDWRFLQIEPAMSPGGGYDELLRQLSLQSALMMLLAIGFKLHLWLLNPLFLRLGRLDRLLKWRRSDRA